MVEPSGGQVEPPLFFEDSAIGFVVPVDLQFFALCVIIGTCEPRHGRASICIVDPLDQPTPGAHLDQLARFGQARRQRLDRESPLTNQRSPSYRVTILVLGLA
jgi:hypothetical protein